MVIYSTKLTTGKKLVLLAFAAALVLALILALTGRGKAATEHVQTNDDRVAYLQACGYEVEAQPIQTQEVRIPTDPGEMFQRYNALQQEQGFDLTAYSGKRIKRYVYQVTNGEDGAETTASLLMLGSTIIGGDVTVSGDRPSMQGLPLLD